MIVLLAGCAGAQAAPQEAGRPEHAPGRILVKLRPEAAERVRREEEKWGERLTPDQLPLEALRTVSERHKVTEWKRLVPGLRGSDGSGMDRVYILECPPETDILQAAQEINAVSQWVEYAEPDYIAYTQGS